MSQNFSDDYDDEDWTPPTPEEMKAIQERRERMDKVSREIGTKLLAGWALLDLVCPSTECHTPLMRDPQKRLWCLACNLQVIQEHEYDPKKHNAIGNTAPSPVTEPKSTATSPVPSTSSSSTTFITPSTPTLVQETEIKSPETKREEPRIETVTAPAIQSQLVSASLPEVSTQPLAAAPTAVVTQAVLPARNSRIAEDTIMALEQKLQWANAKISNPTTSVEEVTRVCDMIRACASALEAVLKVSAYYKN